jgi:hypothetical protein
VTGFFAALGQNLVVESFEPLHLFAEGDRVVVLGRERMRVVSTGKVYTVEWTHLFALRDGKIARFQEYTDTAAIIAALS